MIQVTANRNGGNVAWTATFKDRNEWSRAVEESHPDDQLWARIPEGSAATDKQMLDTAIAIVESDGACTITIKDVEA